MNSKIKFEKSIQKNNSLICLGLDPDLKKIPAHVSARKNTIFEFNKAIIGATHDFVACYKPNIAFYEAYGIDGLQQLKLTIDYIQKQLPSMPILLDAKRGDIGNTAAMYAKAVFEYWNADAVTVYPHVGKDAVEPFFKYTDKLTILLIKTSNPDSGMFQDLNVEGEPFYLAMARKITTWNYDNLALFVGATYPKVLKKVRDLFPNRFFLSAGTGAQGAELKKAIRAGVDKRGAGIVYNFSRSIIYGSNSRDFAEKARSEAEKLRDEINTYRS